MVVKATLSSNDRPDFKYSWSLDKGTIVSELNSPEVSIDTGRIEMDKDSMSTQITVSLEITGPASGCIANTAGKYGVYIIGDFFPIDIYGNAFFKDEMARLDNLATQVLNSKKMIGYIIKGFKKGTPEKDVRTKIERIKRFLFIERKYPKDRFVIAVGPSQETTVTKLWRLPSDLGLSLCNTCRIY